MTLQETRERLIRLARLFEEMAKENETIPILVEGKRDVGSLKELGMGGDILVLHCGLSILELCEQLARDYPEVILMLDWDRKGQQLTERTRRNLTSLGVKVNERFMAKIFSLAKKETKEVEGLANLMHRLAKSSKRYRLDKFEKVAEFSQRRGLNP